MPRNLNTECSVCGKPIYRRPYELARNSVRFCSQKCRGKSQRLTNRNCLNCDIEFVPRHSATRYCSHACANALRRIGTKNYGGEDRRSRIKLLKQAFGSINQCMIEGCEYNNTFDVHRFIPGKDGGTYSVGNMFAICPNHHAEITRGLITVSKIDDCTLRID